MELRGFFTRIGSKAFKECQIENETQATRGNLQVTGEKKKKNEAG